MSKKEFKEFEAILQKQQEEVKTSKKAAHELLSSLGLLNAQGKLKKSFKAA